MDEVPKGIFSIPAPVVAQMQAFVRDELATQILCALIAGRRGLVEPSLWAMAYEMADARPTFSVGVTVEHAEPALADLVVMRAPPGPSGSAVSEAVDCSDCLVAIAGQR